ncbi:MAG: hypothetical protein AAGN35_06605 [Bacteroidota bacterium]
MPPRSDLQARLFARLRELLPSHLSLATELAALLEISVDSAYRRMRGETPLRLDEFGRITRKFGIGLGGLDSGGGQHIQFERSLGRVEEEQVHGSFAALADILHHLQQAGDSEIVYFSMELPIFHVLQSGPLLAFKLYYWNWIDREYRTQPGSIKLDLPGDPIPLARIVSLYQQVPTTEIISENALSTTMMQILFFLESGSFAQASDAILLFDEIEKLVDHLRIQAEVGQKFPLGNPRPDHRSDGNFRLFFNEMIHSQDLALVRAQGHQSVYLEHNVLGFLRTTDSTFFAQTDAMLQRIMRKSILISQVSERERNRFFNRLTQRVRRMRTRAERLREAD